jgi:uncharacterized protein YjdB
MKKFKIFLLMLLIAGVALVGLPTSTEAASIPTIKYKAYTQDNGWMKQVSNGATAGTTGKSKRLEAIQINLVSGKNSMIQYRAHVATKGWQSWVTSGKTAGTMHQSLAIEAVQIKLTGNYAKKYDVYYRAYVREVGWLGWTKNGATAGSTGLDVRMEAIQIKLVKKGTKISSSIGATLSTPTVKYNTYVQNKKWTGEAKNGNTAGTMKKSLRVEALKITLNDFKGKSGIRYKVHVQDSGWQGWVSSGKVAGKENSKKRIEAVKIELQNNLVKIFDVYYRVYVQDYGWLGWAMKGSLRVEAIQVKLIPKQKSVAQNVPAFHDFSDIKTEAALQTLYNTSVSGASDIWYNDDAHTQISCAWLTKRKAVQHGFVYPDWYGNGKQVYGIMHDTDYYTVKKYAGSNCLNNMVSAEGKRLTNIVVSFPHTRDQYGNIDTRYGHVLYIDQIVNGIVYWSDMDNTTQMKKGTIAEFLNRYSYPNGAPVGCVHIIKK